MTSTSSCVWVVVNSIATLRACQIQSCLTMRSADQNNLVITPDGKPTITVDNLEVAQFIYLLLNNPKIRDVAETIRTLAHLARFILADLTDPSSIPLELEAIVPHLDIPVQPLLLETKKEFSMFASLRKYQWVLPTYTYQDIPSLLISLEHLLASAEQKADELAIEKARRLIEP
jgi:hypothetical protein